MIKVESIFEDAPQLLTEQIHEPEEIVRVTPEIEAELREKFKQIIRGISEHAVRRRLIDTAESEMSEYSGKILIPGMEDAEENRVEATVLSYTEYINVYRLIRPRGYRFKDKKINEKIKEAVEKEMGKPFSEVQQEEEIPAVYIDFRFAVMNREHPANPYKTIGYPIASFVVEIALEYGEDARDEEGNPKWDELLGSKRIDFSFSSIEEFEDRMQRIEEFYKTKF